MFGRLSPCRPRRRSSRLCAFGSFDFFLQPGRIVFLAKHFHVAAQRHDADTVLGFTPGELAELPAADVEAEVELLALDAAELGDHEVPQLVYEDDHPQADGDLQERPA